MFQAVVTRSLFVRLTLADMFLFKFFWATLFGALGGVMAVLCLNAVWSAEQEEARETDIRYEEFQNRPQEHDERFC